VLSVGFWVLFGFHKQTFVLKYHRESADILNTTKSTQNGNFVASKVGKKYYPFACASVQRIKPENIIIFLSEKDAQNAGFMKSNSCK